MQNCPSATLTCPAIATAALTAPRLTAEFKVIDNRDSGTWPILLKPPVRNSRLKRPSVVSGRTSVRIRFGSSFSSKVVVCGQFCDFALHDYHETLKWLSSPTKLMQMSFWW